MKNGGTYILNYHDNNMWPKYLCVNIEIDDKNWLFKNTDGFDLFTFILNEEKLISDNHLIFYNNLKDPDLIIQDISETDALETSGLDSYDQVLLLDLSNLKINQSIKVFCQFIRKPKKKLSFLKRFFQGSIQEKHQTISGYISFHFLDNNYCERWYGSHGSGGELNLCIELLEITKINENRCKVTCIMEVSDISLEIMIRRHLKAANSM